MYNYISIVISLDLWLLAAYFMYARIAIYELIELRIGKRKNRKKSKGFSNWLWFKSYHEEHILGVYYTMNKYGTILFVLMVLSQLAYGWIPIMQQFMKVMEILFIMLSSIFFILLSIDHKIEMYGTPLYFPSFVLSSFITIFRHPPIISTRIRIICRTR